MEISYCEVCRKEIKGDANVCSAKCGSLWLVMYMA